MKIDIEDACRAVCSYCRMGMPLGSNRVHVRPFGEFMDAGTDDQYPCEATGIRNRARLIQRQVQPEGEKSGQRKGI